MPDHIMTRSCVSAEAMQFEGIQKNVNAIQHWIDEYNPAYRVVWNGHEEYFSKVDGELIEAFPGSLELLTEPLPSVMSMECMVGDWIVKSSRDTFYTVQQQDFNEIWEVL